MAYCEETAQRFRDRLDGLVGLSEKKMFGGLGFMVNGNMVGGTFTPNGDAPRFMFRVGKENDITAQGYPGAEPMIQGGRRMSGFFWVDAEDLTDSDLQQWISLSLDNALALPPK